MEKSSEGSSEPKSVKLDEGKKERQVSAIYEDLLIPTGLYYVQRL